MTTNRDVHFNKILEDNRLLKTFKNFFSFLDGEAVEGTYWYDKNGKFTDDPKEVVKKIPKYIPKTRLALNDTDFELIYRRELKKANSVDSPNFYKWIVKKVLELKNLDQLLSSDKSKELIELQDLADKFLVWVNNRNQLQTPEAEHYPAAGLLTKYNAKQLAELHKALLTKKYISEIEENDFVYWLSGQPLKSGMKKIRWRLSKSKAMYLLGQICVDLNLSTANNCVETDKKGLDSNNKPKAGYSEIDEILKTLRPIEATP